MQLTRSSWVLLAGFALPLPFLFLASLAPDPQWLKRVWDVGHVPLFAAWMAMAVRLLPLPRTVAFVSVRALALLGIAVAIEFIQLHTGRQFSMADVYLDACGIALGARLSLPPIPRKWLRRLVDVVLIVCIALGLQKAGKAVFYRVYASTQFPQLWSSTQIKAWSRIGGSSKRKMVSIAEAGQPLLQVTYSTAKYSTLELPIWVGDWRGYSDLNLTMLNPRQTPLEISCRVHDRPHYGNGDHFNDRFTRRVTLAPGWNTTTFSLQDIESAPATRRMEMENIENLTCFTIQLPSPQQVYFKEIWLSR